MKRYIKSSNRYVLYEGQQLALQNGETKPQAVSRFRAQKAQEEADALEAKRIADEMAERKAKSQQRVKYKDGTIVLGKDGKYYEVWQGYYHSPDKEVYYEAFPCLEDGKPDWNEIDAGGVGYELGQKEIQRKIN